MDTIMITKRSEAPDVDSPKAKAAAEKEAERKARHERSKRIAAERKAKETPVEVSARSDVAADVEVRRRRSGAPASSRAWRWPITPACSTSGHSS